MTIKPIAQRTFVNTLEELPEGEHMVIIQQSSVFIPGDERSRTNPGHGYSEETRKYLQYVVYKDKSEWEAEIKRLMLEKEKFRAVIVKPVKVEITHTLTVHP